jgi:hypothetical protein
MMVAGLPGTISGAWSLFSSEPLIPVLVKYVSNYIPQIPNWLIPSIILISLPILIVGLVLVVGISIRAAPQQREVAKSPLELSGEAINAPIEKQQQENNKPAIETVVEKEEGNCHYLEVRNIGSVGKFTAQIEIIEDTTDRLTGKIYIGYWILDVHHNEAEIKYDHVDRLRIVRIDNIGRKRGISLDYYDTESEKLASFSYKWGGQPNKVPTDLHELLTSLTKPPRYTLRIVISSVPDLKGGSFVTEYKIDGDDLCQKESDKQPKLMNLLTLLALQQQNRKIFPTKQG